VTNYGCPGESTVTFTTGCPYPDELHNSYAGSQRDAALAFLDGPDGKKTRLVTLTLWGNDINAFLAACQGDPVCVLAGAPAEIAAFQARLTAILEPLEAKHATVVVTGVYDPTESAFSHPLFVALDEAIAAAAQATGARFAPLLATFSGHLCELTLLCADGDAHPSDAGYAAIAAAIENA
jgi:lysophospholipase L1-like esterase